MPKLQIQVIAGAGGPAVLEFTRSPVTYGRDQACDIVLAASTASRQHGELVLQDGEWMLVNLSPNATFVDGKRVTNKPYKLADRNVISIGELEAFRVIVPRMSDKSVEPQADDAESDEPAPPPKATAQRKRMRVWMAIGIYMAAMVVLMVALSFFLGKKPVVADYAVELTLEQIERDVRRPLSVNVVDDQKAREQLADAAEYLAKEANSPDALYRAHRAYKLALAYMGQPRFDAGPEQLRFNDTEKRLIETVSKQYDYAYGLLRSQQFRRADDEFRKLNHNIYPDTTSEIFKNVERQRAIAVAKLKSTRGM